MVVILNDAAELIVLAKQLQTELTAQLQDVYKTATPGSRLYTLNKYKHQIEGIQLLLDAIERREK